MQVVFAILFMLLHVMMLLKMAPYIKASEDWSSFLSTLGLCLISQGALAMMVELPGEEMKTIEQQSFQEILTSESISAASSTGGSGSAVGTTAESAGADAGD